MILYLRLLPVLSPGNRLSDLLRAVLISHAFFMGQLSEPGRLTASLPSATVSPMVQTKVSVLIAGLEVIDGADDLDYLRCGADVVQNILGMPL